MKEEKTIGWVCRRKRGRENEWEREREKMREREAGRDRERGKYFKRNRGVELGEWRREENSFWVNRRKWKKKTGDCDKINYKIWKMEVYRTSAECFQID